jgi:hypothetical protein
MLDNKQLVVGAIKKSQTGGTWFLIFLLPVMSKHIQLIFPPASMHMKHQTEVDKKNYIYNYIFVCCLGR